LVLGLGFDLVDIKRIERLIENEHFFNRVYSEREREYIIAQGKSAPQSAAGIFAAKEAFSKSLGTGIVKMSLQSIEVLHDELGAPYFHLSEGAYDAAKSKNASFLLTITHTDTTAGAVVIAQNDTI